MAAHDGPRTTKGGRFEDGTILAAKSETSIHGKLAAQKRDFVQIFDRCANCIDGAENKVVPGCVISGVSMNFT